MKWRKYMVPSGCIPIWAGCVRQSPETLCRPVVLAKMDATDITVRGMAFGRQICLCNILASNTSRISPRGEAEHQGGADCTKANIKDSRDTKRFSEYMKVPRQLSCSLGNHPNMKTSCLGLAG